VARGDRDSDLTRGARLAAAGTVGASIAHELRNALAVVDSSLYLARRDLDDRESLLRHLDQVSAEVRKAHAVIGSVLGLARGDPVARDHSPVTKLIESARHELVLPTNVTFQVAVEPNDLCVFCDPVLMERVLSNLYLNAADALAGRGRGSIRTRVWNDSGESHIEVSDDGKGVDEDLLDRIFEPLVTDKEDGTGLGLALCRIIVEAHGGTISMRRDNPGTTVRVSLAA
jgi:signal transduction histidine kinase